MPLTAEQFIDCKCDTHREQARIYHRLPRAEGALFKAIGTWCRKCKKIVLDD